MHRGCSHGRPLAASSDLFVFTGGTKLVGCARGGLNHHSRGGSERSQGAEGDSDVTESTRAAHAYQTAAAAAARWGWPGVSRELTRAAGTHASSDLKRSSDDETGLTRTRVDADGRLRTLETAFGRMNTRRTAAEAAGGARAGGGWLVWCEAPTLMVACGLLRGYRGRPCLL